MANAYTSQGPTVDINKALASGGLTTAPVAQPKQSILSTLSRGLKVGGGGLSAKPQVTQGSNPGLLSSQTGAPQTPPPVVPTTPVKSQTSPDGTKVEYHAPPKTDTPPASSGTTPGVIPPKPAPPLANSTSETIDPASAARTLYKSSEQTPDERAATNAVAYGLGVRNNNTFGQYAEAGLLGTDPQAYVNEANAPDLAGRAGATRGLAGNYANLYGTQAQAYLSSAQTAAGRGLSASQGVLNASLPQQQGLTTLYNPLDPNSANTSNNSILDRATLMGNASAAQGFAQDYQSGVASLKAADTIENQITSTLSANPTLNANPVSFLTSLNQYLSGQLGSAPQQLLAQQVNSYINTLGLDPASVVQIASQQKGTLGQLLSSLRDTAQALVESKNPTNVKSTSAGSTGGNLFGNFFSS